MLTHIKDAKNHWTVVVGNQSYQFDHTHPEYDNLRSCVMEGQQDEFLELIDTASVIEDWSEGNFEMRDGFLFYEDEQVASQPTQRVCDLIKGGHDHKPMLNYLDKLYQNVSNRAVMESYDWCSHKGLPITPDGMLVGYKGVAVYTGEDTTDKMGNIITEGDLVDKYTGSSFRNNTMDTPSMNRRKVSDDCTQGCAAGLHVGTYEYANSWAGNGGKVVLVKFDPADIVSVPTDCQHQKMRVSGYTVIGIARDIIEEAVYMDEDIDMAELLDEDYYDQGVDF